MEATIDFGAEQFTEFIRCISNIKEVCNDVDIKGSIIRQRTNDNTSIFEMNLNPIFQDTEIDMALTNLKAKIELFKSFQGQDVTLEISDDYFIFSDEYGFLKFANPTSRYIDNKFMPTEELEGIFSVSEDDLILSKELKTIITDRIRVVTQAFNILSIQVHFKNDKADLIAAAESKDQSATFIKEIETNMIFENSSSNLSIGPFVIDHDTDIEFKMYKDPNQNVALNQIFTTLGSIEIKNYSRSAILEDE